MKNVVFLLTLAFCGSLAAANLKTNEVVMHTDTLNIPMNLDSAYAHYTEQVKSPLFDGYTIQLFSGNRNGANSVRANIISLGAEEDARIVYREPNFKIHVGSYPDVSTAERALVSWKSYFPDAFVLKTLVPWYPITLDKNSAPSNTVNNEP
ncbi:hypothetical protein OAQ85_04265 [Schleiferiaceae bacterium]|nr:hypothetical protein [Schleiferiaceae bacterium]